MTPIEKEYFALEELEERWQLPRRDLAYLAENGLLKVVPGSDEIAAVGEPDVRLNQSWDLSSSGRRSIVCL